MNSAAATGAWQINCQVVRTLRGGANLPRQTSIRPGKPSAVDEARAVRRDAGVPLRAGTAFRPVQQDDDDGGHSDSSWPVSRYDILSGKTCVTGDLRETMCASPGMKVGEGC